MIYYNLKIYIHTLSIDGNCFKIFLYSAVNASTSSKDSAILTTTVTVTTNTMPTLLRHLLNIKPIKMYHKTCEYPLQQNSENSKKWINIIFLHSMLSSSLSAFSIPMFIEPLSNTLRNKLSMNIRCYLLDARNHGLSPWNEQFCLESICVDLNEFISSNNIETPLFLIGHSMGGKASLLYSLLCGDDITGIVSLDASPTKYYHNHQRIFDAMKGVNFDNLTNETPQKYQIMTQLKQNGIENASEIGFILNNIDFDNDNNLKWKCNLDVISENEDKIHGFPDTKYMSIYDKYTLFLGGTIDSDRLTNKSYLNDVEFWFPFHRIHLLNGGHFIHRTHYKHVEHEIVEYFIKVLS